MMLYSASSVSGVLDIEVNQQKLALPYRAAVGDAKGAVLIIHGSQPIYGQSFVNRLSDKLAMLGWSTLLIQTYQINDKAKLTDIIPSSLTALRLKDNNRLVVIHYGDQLQVSLDYFVQPQSKQANGMILLSAYDRTDAKKQADLLKKLRFPAFDIVGQFDYGRVLRQAKKRHDANSENSKYQFLMLPGARHQYTYTSAMLAAYVNGWMEKLSRNIRASPPIPS
ncbi:alpha/beta hydrolase [Legionella spiritensis]|uniref:alpha/beta hydrolase n=1 Tax=Legionella spiritensis TaxID=452 RepID=UPI0010544AD9|nr:alpha/beta hydrolase [Legionella spiritensis]